MTPLVTPRQRARLARGLPQARDPARRRPEPLEMACYAGERHAEA